MPVLQTQKDFRKVKELSFFYYCGEPFNETNEKTRDHVPPESIFLIQDRTPPLILNAHSKCNGKQSYADNEIGQLISILHDKIPERKNKILRFGLHKNEDGKITGLLMLDLEGIILRWIRGFHAALYREYLPIPSLKAIHTPINQAIIKGIEIFGEPIQPQQLLFVEIIKKNRKAGKLDKIVCNNGKCKYECLWFKSTKGKWFCMFALQVYNWSQLGDGNHFPSRGCVGFYCPISGVPQNAAREIDIEGTFENQEKLDPFGA